MKVVYDYYVLDTVSESVVGVVQAPNCDYAKKAICKGLKKSFDDGLLNPDDICVVCYDHPHDIFEVFNEVNPLDSDFKDYTSFVFDKEVEV